MYSKEERIQLHHEFWTTFDKYTLFYGNKINVPIKWMYYKTGIKGLELKFDIDSKNIFVSLEISLKNNDKRFEMYVFLDTYHSVINNGFNENPFWEENYLLKEGKTVSRIYCQKKGLNYHNRDQWPAIYEFMATNMLQLQNNVQEILPIMQESFK